MIESILDTDLYKISMGQAILFGKLAGINFESINVEYELINRGKTQFPDGFDKKLRSAVNKMSQLYLTSDERKFLEEKCKYLKHSYLDFLSGYRFNPNEIQIIQNGGDLKVKITGPWYRTVFWEVPLMALISEIYHDNRISPEQLANFAISTVKKSQSLSENNCRFADFGTRRRYSKNIHMLALSTIKRALKSSNNVFNGTSNVYFAYLMGLNPLGTHAHEYFMAHGALFGYKLANLYTLESWVNEYDGDLGIALTDTYTTDVFFNQFTMKLAKLFDGLRQDSGDPIEFAKKAINHYNKLRINPMSKTIIFSDDLNVDKCIKIKQFCENKINAAFGIGTNLTCDISGVTPLKIVVKMTKCNGIPTIKLSDDPGKHTGDLDSINICKKVLGI